MPLLPAMPSTFTLNETPPRFPVMIAPILLPRRTSNVLCGVRAFSKVALPTRDNTRKTSTSSSLDPTATTRTVPHHPTLDSLDRMSLEAPSQVSQAILALPCSVAPSIPANVLLRASRPLSLTRSTLCTMTALTMPATSSTPLSLARTMFLKEQNANTILRSGIRATAPTMASMIVMETSTRSAPAMDTLLTPRILERSTKSRLRRSEQDNA